MKLNDPIVRNPTFHEQLIIRLLIATGVISIVHFCYNFFQPRYYGEPLLYALLACVIVYGLVRDMSLWYYYAAIKVPLTPELKQPFTVDVLTTYFPGEPYDMIETTLWAIQAIRYPHTTYLCDEADDPRVKQLCSEIGVIHVTRSVRVDAKAGNINNALRQATGEICLILDPDHIPEPEFLDHIIPHFQNESIGFVQTVQAYYNKFDSLVAKGSAQQTFHFYGPMMMSMNTYGTVNAIGANCTFRRRALDSIGGHAPGLAEDMHTAMLLYREGWQSVYVPRILARGLVPASITAYFKQQLKWSRGTFDLLVKVYPRIFSRLTWRQRLHYALMPVHYLAGVVYFIGFLIPILSLVWSEVPWTGNFGFFLLLIAPVIFTSFLLRFYIQKWLISDDERGFHIVGGILEILTWWVFALGFFYTLVNKKVPYLPTPKNDGDATHYTLLLPNLTIGIASLAAIVYGLPRDFTPFSLIMACFALLNAAFMFFSVYLAFGVTNRNGLLRDKLPSPARSVGRHAKRQLLWALDAMTVTVRKLAPFILVAIIGATSLLMSLYNQQEFEMIEPAAPAATTSTAPKLGIFFPADESGLSELNYISGIKPGAHSPVDIVSSYIPWSGGMENNRISDHLQSITARGFDPMITWEPWVSHFPGSDTDSLLRQEKRGLIAIAEGRFDEYVISFARQLAALERPVYLRFAHEFDNPGYPWSTAGDNRPQDFIAAWRHIHGIFQQVGAGNVRWVWNPWQPQAVSSYYPGKDFVDYIGLTALNYGPYYDSLPVRSFQELYAPFADQLTGLPPTPVVIAELGSLGTPVEKREWVRASRQFILDSLPEIHAIVAFNSAFDENLPTGSDQVPGQRLDWTLNAHTLFKVESATATAADTRQATGVTAGLWRSRPLPTAPVHAVGYKKGAGWSTHRYIPSRANLEHDFGLMRAAGINSIRITEPGMYDYNLMTISEEYGLKVIYNFWVSETIDFVADSTELARLHNEIMDQVHEQVDRQVLLHWNFGNDVLANLAAHHLQPTLHRQRVAYLNWLGALIREIKRVDHERAVMIAVAATTEGIQLLEEYELLDGPCDAVGLTVGGSSLSDRALTDLLDRYAGQVVLADIDAQHLATLPPSSYQVYTVVSNWQNEWRMGKLSFDGLLDFGSRPTEDYVTLSELWSDRPLDPINLPAVAVLAPALQPIVGQPFTYRALVRDGGKWMPARTPFGDYSLKWNLVKTDAYGNPIALRQLGEGADVEVQLPVKHLEYQILLTITDGTYAHSVRSPLLPR